MTIEIIKTETIEIKPGIETIYFYHSEDPTLNNLIYVSSRDDDFKNAASFLRLDNKPIVLRKIEGTEKEWFELRKEKEELMAQGTKWEENS